VQEKKYTLAGQIASQLRTAIRRLIGWI